MNAVDRTKAGVASGTLSMTRMVGGTFGVAALGALVAGVGRHDLAQSLPQRPAGDARAARRRRSAPAPRPPARRHAVRAASEQAFVDALGTGLTIAAIATALAALAAWFLIDPTRPAARAPRPRPRRPTPRLPWSSARARPHRGRFESCIARAARAGRVLLDRPRPRRTPTPSDAARRGAGPAPGRARGHARVRPAAEDRRPTRSTSCSSSTPRARPASPTGRPSRSRSTSTSPASFIATIRRDRCHGARRPARDARPRSRPRTRRSWSTASSTR